MKPDRNSYTTLDFAEWRAASALDIAPKFQRRGVWNTPKRSFLIDTIIRDLPVPPIYLRQKQNVDRTRTIREVIDGQQRVSAILDFIDGKYALSKTLEGTYAGKRFGKLPQETQDAIRNYSLNCETFVGIDDETVLQIFARMNTYSVQLNAQELRNGKFFGFFRQAIYSLALEHNSYWLKHKIVSNQGIARMSEAELVSELLIAQIGGQQDKKKSINQYYDDFDESFPEEKTHTARFRGVLDEINETLGDELKALAWHRLPMFYTLFCVTYHRIYGLPGETGDSTKKRSTLTQDDRSRLFDSCVELSDVLGQAKADQRVVGKYSKFVAASSRQTDNIGPRQMRFLTLFRQAFGA